MDASIVKSERDQAVRAATLMSLTRGLFIPFVLKSRVFSTKNGWVCGDREVVGVYDADPLCGFEFTANGCEALPTLMARAYDPAVPAPNANLPVAFFPGAKNPVMAGEKNLRRAARPLADAGHGIMNERGEQAVRPGVAEKIGLRAR